MHLYSSFITWERSTNAHKIAILDFVKDLRSSRAAGPGPDPFYWDQDPNLDLIFNGPESRHVRILCDKIGENSFWKRMGEMISPMEKHGLK